MSIKSEIKPPDYAVVNGFHRHERRRAPKHRCDLCNNVQKHRYRNSLPEFSVLTSRSFCSGCLIRPWFLNIFNFLMHSRVLTQPRIFSVALAFASIVACEIIAFQISPFDRQRPYPANESDTSKQAPSKESSMGMNSCGKREKAAGSKGTKTAARS